MSPDFNKKTIDTLAKRAAFKCSNPDCRVSTVGPNSDSQKSTVIGEAAHIFGARQNSKRFNHNMTDAARSDITNSIWLCRNCHKLIDTDNSKYTSDVLFAWREQHEKYIQSELGSTTDRIQFEEQTSRLSLFKECPPLVRRIVIDKPDGWEWRLTAELMRYLNRPLLRKIEDLKDGLYVQAQKYIDGEDVIKWVQMRLAEISKLVHPLSSLINRLNKSWGTPGNSGNQEDIYHITCLIRDHLEQIIKYEEQIHFTNVPVEYRKLVELFKNLLGAQATKIAEIPDALDKVVSLLDTEHGGTVENPLVIEKTITFELPKGWEKQIDHEFKRIERKHLSVKEDSIANGYLAIIIIVIIIWLLTLLF